MGFGPLRRDIELLTGETDLVKGKEEGFTEEFIKNYFELRFKGELTRQREEMIIPDGRNSMCKGPRTKR